MPRGLRIVTILVVGIVVIGLAGMTILTRGIDEVLALNISSIDLTGLPDGTYEGDYTQNRWSYTVLAEIESGRIQDIAIVHSNHESIVGRWNNEIVEEILEKQSLDIQGVSGATATTKALQKAVENALLKN